MNEQIIEAYKWHRQCGRSASRALVLAREDTKSGKRRYPSSTFFSSVVNRPWKSGSTTLRWIENTNSIGLRKAGYADEILRSIGHKGWFTNEFQDETLRGVVYQWPARRGVEQFIYGYDDPCNPGAAALCFDITDDKKDAARCADHVAEQSAEQEREYQAAADARLKFDDLGDEVTDTRRSLLALIRELKEKRAYLCGAHAIIAALQNSITDKLVSIQEARVKREELKNSFSYHDGWAQG